MESVFTRTATLAVLFSLAIVPTGAEERTLTFTPDQTSVDWTLEATGHDVEGTFKLVSGEITWDNESGTAYGIVDIDATSAKTGSDSRDETMNEDVLESTKYPRFTFKPNKVDGTIKESGTSSIRLHGVLNIHGQDHAIVMPAEVTNENGHLKVMTSFEIPFVEWGMKDPSILFLRVEKSVHVKVSATAAVSAR